MKEFKPEPGRINRRDFLKIIGGGMGAIFLSPVMRRESVVEDEGFVGGIDLGPNSELLPREERRGVITTKEMPVTLLPINQYWLYHYYINWLQKIPDPVREIKLNNVDLAYKDLFMTVSPDGEASRYTIFPYITGDKLIAIGKYDEGTYNEKTHKYSPLKTFYKEEVLDKDAGVPIAQCHTLISRFYPNKLWNDLQASIQIDKYQHTLGGFRSGLPVSYVDAILASVESVSKTYRPGRAGPAAGEVPGGGVCATATNMCKMQIEAGSKITERQTHQVDVRYFYGPGKPFELTPKNADATVYYQDENYREDLVWVPKKDQWIKISAAMVPFADPVSDLSHNGDTLMFLTFRSTGRNPGDQTVAIKKLQDAYDAWRENPTEANKSILLNGSKMTQEINWKPESEITELVRLISPEDKVDRFTAEIKQDQMLKDLVQLRSVLAGYSYEAHYNWGIYLGDYLKKSDWYTAQINRLEKAGASTEDLEKALKLLNNDCNIGHYEQPLQCVGLVVLMGALNYPNAPFYNFYDYDAYNAKTLCPWNWRTIVGEAVEKFTFAKWQEIDKVVARLRPVDGSDRLGRKFTAFNAKSLDEINVGDIFVNMEGEDGHTGCIVGKKNIGEDIVLLVADSNGASNGQIHLHEVDKCNFDVIFGPYPYPKVMVRRK